MTTQTIINLPQLPPPRHPTVAQATRDAAVLVAAPVALLLQRVSPNSLKEFIAARTEKAPGFFESFVQPYVSLLSDKGASPLAVVAGSYRTQFERARIVRRHTHLQDMMRSFWFVRPPALLKDTEKQILQDLAAAADQGHIAPDEWKLLSAGLLADSGQAILQPDAAHVDHPLLPLAQELLKAFLRDFMPEHGATLKATFARLQKLSETAAKVSAQNLRGARWLEPADLPSSPVFTVTDGNDAALPLGQLYPDGPMLGFAKSTHQTIIAPSGSGKSQASIMLGLLSYPGSGLVVDPQQELWNETAGYRERSFGPVYKLAPGDLQDRSNRYNPLDAVSTQPHEAAKQCSVLAHQIIPPAEGKEKYFANRARNLLWAALMIVALGHRGDKRTITAAVAYLMFERPPQSLDGTYELDGTLTGQVIEILKGLATRTGVVELANIANSLERDVVSDHFGSVIETLKEAIFVFTSLPQVTRAIGQSDWSPLTLRQTPGSMVYLCVPPGEMDVFSPLLRVVIQQHIHALIAGGYKAKPGELPVTFWIDELAALGRFEPLLQVYQLGRKAGVRIAVYAQDMDQLLHIYGKGGERFFNEAELRLIMNPSAQMVEKMRPYLGEVTELFSEEKKPLAQPSDLIGRAYADNIIALGQGEYPARLVKQMAYRLLPDRLNWPIRWRVSH